MILGRHCHARGIVTAVKMLGDICTLRNDIGADYQRPELRRIQSDIHLEASAPTQWEAGSVKRKCKDHQPNPSLSHPHHPESPPPRGPPAALNDDNVLV